MEESPRPTSILHIYDVAARSLVRQVALGRNFPSHIRPMPDNRWVVAYGGELWLFDTLEQCAPQRLPGSPNVCDVFVTADGKSVIEVGKDKTVRLWRQRREMSPLGAWGLPETWGLCGLSLVLCLGPVVIAGRDKARTLGAALPKPLWVLVVLGAMGIASSVTGDVLSYATDPFYASSQDNLGLPTALARTAFGILGLMSLLGIMRLRRGWYIFQIVLTSLGLLLVGAVLAVVASGSLGPGSTAATVSRHGYLLQMSIPRAIAVLAGGMVWAGTELVLLLLPSVRAAFYGRRQDTPADVQA